MTTLATIFSGGGMSGDGRADHGVHLQNLAPRLGIDNVFSEANTTASSSAGGSSSARATNFATFDAWRASGTASEWLRSEFTAQLVNYLALAEFDFGGGDVRIQYRSGGEWIDIPAGNGGITANFTDGTFWINNRHPNKGRVAVWEWKSIFMDAIRVLVQDSDTAPEIGVVFAGQAMVPDMGLERSWQPPSVNADARYNTPLNQNGAFLGRNVQGRTAEVDINLNAMEYGWAKDDFLEFVRAAEQSPFFMWWKHQGRSESVYAVTDDHGGSLAGAGVVNTRLSARVVAQ
jgi:hypothetical protein